MEYSATWLTFFIQLSGDVQICIHHLNFWSVALSTQMVSQLSAFLIAPYQNLLPLKPIAKPVNCCLPYWDKKMKKLWSCHMNTSALQLVLSDSRVNKLNGTKQDHWKKLPSADILYSFVLSSRFVNRVNSNLKVKFRMMSTHQKLSEKPGQTKTSTVQSALLCSCVPHFLSTGFWKHEKELLLISVFAGSSGEKNISL